MITISAGLLSLLVVVVYLFSGNVSRMALRSEERMQSTAQFAAALLEDGNFVGTEPIDRRLGALCRSAGCERIVITDDLGLVWWSGQELIERGDDIAPYLIDSTLFIQCIRDTIPRFTPVVRIGGSWFKSLYYPFLLNNRAFAAVIEADQEYLTAARQFRNNIIIIGSAVGAVLASLSVLLVVIARRARRALRQARVNEHLAFLGRTSAEIAHELKNPLGIIKTSVDVLQKKYDPGRNARPFCFISEEIMRLSRLIDSILSFSRDKRLERKPFAPAALVADTFERLVGGNAALSCDISDGITCIGDPEAFARIADNLCRNALQASEEAGTVAITAEQKKKSLHLLFSDRGPGIPQEIRHTLFEPFVTGRCAGTGLGLAIVKILCTRMGWDITLERSDSSGTCFAIKIPEGLWRES